MARPREFTEREETMHLRCQNWGLEMAGGRPTDKAPPDLGFTPDAVDARVIERGMCKMRWEKHLHYWLLRYLYLGGLRSNIEAANYFNKSERWVSREHKEGLGYLLRHCSEEAKGLKLMQ